MILLQTGASGCHRHSFVGFLIAMVLCLRCCKSPVLLNERRIALVELIYASKFRGSQAAIASSKRRRCSQNLLCSFSVGRISYPPTRKPKQAPKIPTKQPPNGLWQYDQQSIGKMMAASSASSKRQQRT